MPSILDNEFYVPDINNLGAQSQSNRQGRDEVLTGDEANEVLEILKNDALNLYSNYEKMMYIDIDIRILDHSPNIFEHVKTFGMAEDWMGDMWRKEELQMVNYIPLRCSFFHN